MEKELPELKVSMLGRFSMTYGEQTVSFKRNTATKAVKLLQILLTKASAEAGNRRGFHAPSCWKICLAERNFQMAPIIFGLLYID